MVNAPVGPPGGFHHVPATTSTLVVPNSATQTTQVVGDHRRVLLVRQKEKDRHLFHHKKNVLNIHNLITLR